MPEDSASILLTSYGAYITIKSPGDRSPIEVAIQAKKALDAKILDLSAARYSDGHEIRRNQDA